ncbi:M56 family metallopeptidase [Dyella sp. LX-66]|uniref:M56 family metallopeptidase n=1 Tax=unclassified Dyella TaxID=2634549 RepID=UPI001BE07EB6|nr:MULTISPECIES: M56 family metallopeptidase [unclassified Dyella]MBT2115397.1 M56 family metallopeptidase [Dyella sp. LX-1]MBT2139212.1 M56 family metallopeptidase [Dyella sp. LX-66]
MSSSEWLSRLWLAQLAFSMACVAVLLLRRPCRNWLGAERAFQLWMLPPLAMLISQLPHAPAPTAGAPTLVYVIASAGGALPALADRSRAGIHAADLLLALWVLGVAVVATCGWLLQRRYRQRLRGAHRCEERSARWPVWLAASADVGPALLGAWRPRIVLPADFATRYDAQEQALVLAHEQAHADRRDGLWSLCALITLALCWPHTLAWWCWHRFRHDQELACDAAVMRVHRGRRKQYAEALLKTQMAAMALPVGCTWSPRHPLTERIAMLKAKPDSILRRRLGSIALAACTIAMAGVVYAATPAAAARTAGAAHRYALQIDIGYDGEAPSTHMRQCLKQGVPVQVSGSADGVPGWHASFAVVPVDGGLLEVRGDLNGGNLDHPVHPAVRTRPGEKATIQVGEVNHSDPKASIGLRIDLTPRLGC